MNREHGSTGEADWQDKLQDLPDLTPEEKFEAEVIILEKSEVDRPRYLRGPNPVARIRALLNRQAESSGLGKRAQTGPNFEERYKKRSPSSYSKSTWANEQGLNQANGSRTSTQPLFLCHRPDWAEGMAAPLIHPVFGTFMDGLCDSSLPTRRDYRFVADLCQASLIVYSKEKERQLTVQALLDTYLGVETKGFLPDPESSSSMTDGYVGDRSSPPQYSTMVIEYANELGSTQTDKMFQGMSYYARLRLAMNDAVARLGAAPCFLVEIQGPYIRVSGLGYFQRVHAMPLTPYLFLGITPSTAQLTQLVCAMAALRRGQMQLKEWYQHLLPLDPERPLLLAPEFALPWVFWTGEYTSRLSAVKAIAANTMFEASFEGKTVAVKFVQRYGDVVHRAWARAGLAPALHLFQALPGGWYMVIMELLPWPQWKCLDDCPRELLPAARSMALAALADAHRLEVFGHGRGSVHGDARDTNVMVDVAALEKSCGKEAGGSGGSITPPACSGNSSQAAGMVQFIDFDWAGEDGVDRYPPLMSPHVVWSEGAADNQVMRQCHDRQLLGLEQQNVRDTYLWRRDCGA